MPTDELAISDILGLKVMRRPKKHQPHRRAASVDGMLPSSGRLGLPLTHKTYQPNTSQQLGVLPTSDGFHPYRNTPQGMGGDDVTEQMIEEPIVIDEPPKAKTKKPRPRWRRIAKRGSLIMLALVLVIGGYLGIKFFVIERNVFKGGGKAPALAKNIDISQLKGEGDGRVNILLLGIGGPGHDGPDLTDTILLASIDPINKKATLLSLPRDWWAKIPGNGSQKLNAAYPYGKEKSKSKAESDKNKAGLELVDNTLQPMLGVPIHYHAVVDFKAFEQAVDAVGGVTINVPEQLYDPSIAWENNYNPVIAKVGSQTFNGHRALLYAKSRETSTDFARAQRQRALLVALKDKGLSLGTLANPVKISSLLSSFGNNIYTDLSLNDLLRLRQIGSEIPSSAISSIDLVTPPHDLLTTGNIGGLSVVLPKAGTYEYTAIQAYVRNALKDSFIANENARVAIYNATGTAGLATAQATILKSYGYNVVTVDNAPTTNPTVTALIDLTKGAKKYTKHYLEGRFKTTASGSLPSNLPATASSADFVIILGQNAANTSQN